MDSSETLLYDGVRRSVLWSAAAGALAKAARLLLTNNPPMSGAVEQLAARHPAGAALDLPPLPDLGLELSDFDESDLIQALSLLPLSLQADLLAYGQHV